MATYHLTREGLQVAVVSKQLGILTDGNLPIRIERDCIRDALVYYWGRGIPLDPSHLRWELKKADA